MPIQRQEVSIFSTSFLDVISCGFGAVLLIFLMVTTQSIKQAEEVDKQYVAIAVQLQPIDDNGKKLGGPVPGELRLIVPPNNQELKDIAPSSWVHRLSKKNLSSFCKEVTVQNSSKTVFCVMRGVRVEQCAFQVRTGPPKEGIKRVLLQGWLADPIHGHTSLNQVFVAKSSINTTQKGDKIRMKYTGISTAVFRAKIR